MSTADSPDRRHFITSMAGIASLAAVATAVPWERAGASVDRAPAGAWDDSWTQRLGKHRVVFEQSELEQAPAPVWFVSSVMDGFNESLGTTDADLGMVLVLRHRSVPYFFSDAMWAKYDIAKNMKEVDPATKAPYRVNPLREEVQALQKRGVIVLGCGRAVKAFVSRKAEETKADRGVVDAEVRANMFPGVILQPNGLYAVARAQDVGCGVMR